MRLRSVCPFLIAFAALFVLLGCGTSTPRGCLTCPQHVQSLVYATTNANQVLVFPVAINGGLDTPSSLPGPVITGGNIAVSPSSRELFVSDHVLDTLSAFVENSTSHYSPAPGSPYSLGSNTGSLEGIATTPDGKFVYVVSLGGAVSGFSVASNGSLTVVPGSPFPVANNSVDAVTDAAGKFLFVVNSSSVSVFTIDSASGSLAATGAPVALPASSLPTPGMAATTPSPANYLYVALTSANAVAAFSFDATTGALTPVFGSPFPVGLGPLTLTTTAKAVYVSNPLDGTISALAWDTTTGALTPISGSPFNAQGGSGAMAALYGQYLYLPSTNSIVAFSIDSSGALTPLSGSPFAAGVHLWGGLTAF